MLEALGSILRFGDPISREWALVALEHIPRRAAELLPRSTLERIKSGESQAFGHGLCAFASVRALQSEDEDVRWWAMRKLKYLESKVEGIEDALLSVLKNGRDESRTLAARALGELGVASEEAVLELIDLLEESQDDVRWAAVGALEALRPAQEAAIEKLVTVLDSGGTRARKHAASVLGVVGPAARQAVPSLLRAMGDEEIGWYASGALQKIGDESDETVQALIAGLLTGSMRWGVDHVLKRIAGKSERIVPALLDVVRSGSDEARSRAGWVLADLAQDRRVVPALGEILRSGPEESRWEAGWILERISLRDKRGSVPPVRCARVALRQRVDGSREFEREAQPRCGALVTPQLRRMSAVAVELLKTLAEGEKEARWRAADRLEQMVDWEGGIIDAVVDLIGRADCRAGKEAAVLAGRLARTRKSILEDLIGILERRGSGDCRLLAVHALREASVEAGSLMPRLKRLVDEETGALRHWAAIVLGRRGCGVDEDVLAALIEALQSGDEAARIEVLAALESLGSRARAATPALIELLEDPDEEMRMGAAFVLGKCGESTRPVLDALRGCLMRDGNELVRQVAAVGLGLLLGGAGTGPEVPDGDGRAEDGRTRELGEDIELAERGLRRALESGDEAARGWVEAAMAELVRIK